MPLRASPSSSIFAWTFLANGDSVLVNQSTTQSPGQELSDWAFGTFTLWKSINISRTRLSFLYPILYQVGKSCKQFLGEEGLNYGTCVEGGKAHHYKYVYE